MSIEGFTAAGFEKVREQFEQNFEEGHEVGAAFAALPPRREGGRPVGRCRRRGVGPAVGRRTRSSSSSRRRRARPRCARTSWRRRAGSTSTRRWPRTGPSSRRRARRSSRSATCSATRPVCRGSTRRSPWTKCSHGIRWSRRWADRRRCGSPARRTATTPSPTATSSARWSGGSPGRSLGTYFREEVAEPLGLDFWIGLPEARGAAGGDTGRDDRDRAGRRRRRGHAGARSSSHGARDDARPRSRSTALDRGHGAQEAQRLQLPPGARRGDPGRERHLRRRVRSPACTPRASARSTVCAS